jgi:hypothetical protein
MDAKVGVITARFGLRDQVAPPPAGAEWAICFSDYAAHVHPDWRFRLRSGDRRFAREIKLNPWGHCPRDVDWYLWLDSNATLVVPLKEVVAFAATGESVYVSPHPQRNCVTRELAACRQLRKDDPGVMEAQVDRYLRAGMPLRAGMVETGVLLWKNDERAQRFASLWLREVRYGSARDQLSFNYVAWKHGLSYGLFPQPARGSFARIHKHVSPPLKKGLV